MRIRAEECAGLLIDIQERLFPVMNGSKNLLARARILLKGLKILNIPVLLSEQYPKGLGPTVPELLDLIEGVRPVEKISFSCCGEPGIREQLSSLDKKWIIICGIEAHVCVLQTVTDLIEMGLVPVVVADCIGSRNPDDKKVALKRMSDEGAVITTSESILFELTQTAGTPLFKQISRLVK
jgi:nicotinamidase-related amidase